MVDTDIADGTLEVGNLIAFMTYAMQILMSFMMLSMVFVFIPRGQASAVRINEVLNMESKIKDPKVITKMPTENRGTLDFNHVDFRYEGAERLALKDIDFHGRNGQTVAIIGGTGSGKSSLSNLIPRFYDVESGSIEINGIDIRQMSQHELRDAVGFVPQKAMLFTGTIRENIQYGKKDATDEEIWHALEIAQSKEFVEELPDGLDSYVEQGGGNFSGGQKQRLCIARALIKKADIFVFDDSFSALDFKTDAALRKALKPETKEAVVVIVAQRISTVVDADLILVLDEGELVGMGTHEELKETNATYQEIISSQLREEEIVMSEANHSKPAAGKGPMGGGPGARMPAEKAKNFWPTVKRLLGYMSKRSIAIIAVFVLAITSTIFQIRTPKILGEATTEIFKGVMKGFKMKQAGIAVDKFPIDFDKIATILLIVGGLYIASAVFSFLQQFIMTRVSQKNSI